MFTLDAEQLKKLQTWIDQLPTCPGTAIGGQFTYSFTPTSLGDVVKVKCGFTGQEIDLSDYDSW